MPQAARGAPAAMLCCPSICLVPAPGAGRAVLVRVLLARGTPSLGSPLPSVPGLPGSFLVSLLFSPQRGGVARSLRSLTVAFPWGLNQVR